jgi:cytochrome c oxidase subunit II
MKLNTKNHLPGTAKRRKRRSTPTGATRRRGIWLAAGLGLSLAGCAGSGSPSMLDPQGPDASRIAGLTWLMFAIAAVVFLVVLILTLIAVARRRREHDQLVTVDPARERRTLRWVLLGGVAAPLVVLITVMALAINIENSEAASASASGSDPNTIEVIGHQWWWEVRYPNQNIITANELHLQAGVPYTVKVTTADVIHSFWVPQLHGKIDTIPGQTNTITLQADNIGEYRGECAEYCGLEHAKMDFIVVAQNGADYNAWLAQQKKAAPEPAEGSIEKQGQQAFLGSSCTYCHTVTGTNASGRIGPDLTHIASRQTIGAGLLANTPGNLSGWITNAQALKPGNQMPPINLDAVEVKQIVAYLESLK